jgi:alkylated DNA repair dioxygenase AlkB
MSAAMPLDQPDLFVPATPLPEGLVYQPDVITPEEEQALAARLAVLSFKPFAFRGYFGKRQVVSFGWGYDYDKRAAHPAEPIPDFLLPLRERAAALAGRPGEDFQQALVTEYPAGSGIGWHRDKPAFGEVLGVSLLAPCTLRFRRPRPDGGWERLNLTPQPRSAYLMQGPARTQWEHSISETPAQRYSVTFRRYLGRV